MAEAVKYSKTLHHAIDGEQEFLPVDSGAALAHPEWKRTPWSEAETAAYQSGVAAFEAAKEAFVKTPSPANKVAFDKARAILKAALIKAAPAAEKAAAETEKATS